MSFALDCATASAYSSLVPGLHSAAARRLCAHTTRSTFVFSGRRGGPRNWRGRIVAKDQLTHHVWGNNPRRIRCRPGVHLLTRHPMRPLTHPTLHTLPHTHPSCTLPPGLRSGPYVCTIQSGRIVCMYVSFWHLCAAQLYVCMYNQKLVCIEMSLLLNIFG